MYSVYKCGIFLFPAILVLRNTGVCVGSLNSCNMMPYIKVFVNKALGFYTILWVPNVNLDDSYIRFRRSFDYMSLESKDYIVEKIGFLNYLFNLIISYGRECIVRVI